MKVRASDYTALTPEQALKLYARVARPVLDKCFKPSTCIEQSRVLIEVLARFNIEAEALGTKLLVACKEKQYQFLSGLDDEELQRAKLKASSYEVRADSFSSEWGRHVVVIVDKMILVDSTLAQASSQEHGFHLNADLYTVQFPHVLPEDEVPDLEIECSGDDGTKFSVRWVGTDDSDWEQTEAWEPSHLWPLIDLIEMKMRRRLQVQ